jgi:hypothetical protein
MGLDLHLIESEAMAGQPPVERRPLPVVQRH